MSAPIRILVVLAVFWMATTASAQAPANAPGKVEGNNSPDTLPVGAVQRLGTAQLRLGDSMTFALLTPDGKRAAVVTHQGGVVLLDLATGRLLHRKMENRPYSDEGLALSPDGQVLASLSKPRVIELWDVEKKTRLHLLEAKHPPKSVTFSPDSRWLAVGEAAGQNEGVISLWDVKAGKLVRTFPVIQTLSTRATFSPDGDLLATWGNVYKSPAKGQMPLPSRTIQLWNVASGKEVRRITTDQDRVEAVAFSPDEHWLALLTLRAGLEIRDAQTGKLQHKLTPQLSWARFLKFSPDGKYLVAVERYGKVQLWETATWKSRLVTGGPAWWVTSVAFPEKQVLACGIAGQSVQVRDLTEQPKKTTPTVHRFPIQSLQFLSNGGVLSADVGGLVFLWERETGKPLGHWNLVEDVPQPSHVNRQFPRIATSPGGKYLAAYDLPSQQIYVWDLPGKRKVLSLPGPRHELQAGLAFSHDHKLAVLTAALGGDKQTKETVAVWDVAAEKEIRTLTLPPAPPNLRRFGFGHVAFSPDGQLLAAAVQHNVQGKVGTEVFLWDLKTGYKKNHLLQNISFSPVLAFSPDGALLALGGPQEGIALVNVWTGKRLRLEGVDRSLDAVAFSPDGRTIAGTTHHTKDPTATIYVWETVTGTIRNRLSGHQGKIHALSYSPDGKTLGSAGIDSTILLWDTTGKQQFAKKQPPAGDEWNQLWNRLQSVQGKDAFPAMGQLAGHSQVALALLKEHLRPQKEKVVGPDEIRKMVADLDAPKFMVREQATLALKQLGERALPELNKAMKTDITLEMRLRIEKILDEMHEPQSHPEELRYVRAVELLEHIGSPQAQQQLRELAGGTRGGVLTEEARAALARMNPGRDGASRAGPGPKQ